MEVNDGIRDEIEEIRQGKPSQSTFQLVLTLCAFFVW